MQVILRLKSKEEVEIHVHSRSISTASLLKVWIMKNIPDCTAVFKVAKPPGLENCFKDDKLNFSNFQPVVAAERRSDNNDCFIVDNQSALNYKDDFVDLLLNQCSNV
uniref:Uncharacterized protein n=1 Tax=Ciona savignyi TaxID=51511 RepID=H2ZIR1_CIOSA